MLPHILGCYQSKKREKMGKSGTGRAFTQSIEWLVLRLPPDRILLFPLGQNRLPMPMQKETSADNFLTHFLPEPLVYEEYLAPSARVLARLLRDTKDAPLDQGALSDAERALYTVVLAALGSAGHADPPAAARAVLESAIPTQAEDDVQKASINAFGIHLRKQKNFDAAIQFYRKALELDPNDVRLLFNLARALYEKGDMAECRSALEQALELTPTFVEAQKFLKHLERQGIQTPQEDALPDITL